MTKIAFVTGITGQDGSYLAELLLEKGYEVHGLIRRASTFNTGRIEHLYQDPHKSNTRLKLHYGDLSDAGNLEKLIREINPDEIYHLGAQSHVRVSFDIPEYTGNITGLATIRLLESIMRNNIKCKFYQASSSEMFGKVKEEDLPISEKTLFHPRSPYACAKIYGYWSAINFREAYNIFAVNGILFNHESSRRGETFVSRKVTRGLARIKLGMDEKLYLGNLDAKRDWGHAKDYVKGMWQMMQQDTPDDYVLATNEVHTVREMVEIAGKYFDMNIKWEGEGLAEKGIDTKTGKTIIEIDEKYFRPTEVDVLLGDYSKAKEKLGWEPETSFEELIAEMCESDYNIEKKKDK
ncbi:GDP-mannose 4,6-dehydratase [Patescibacteria group bacterium]|nr:GDP-mannose 4,6-dehydratase [Patescibacteria group bacterium]